MKNTELKNVNLKNVNLKNANLERVKCRLYTWGLMASIIGIIGVLAYGMTHETVAEAAEKPPVFEQDVYVLEERSVAEFQPVIMEKFNEESELVVCSVETTESLDLKQMGIFDWNVLNKTQSLKYKGIGTFYVDLSSLGEKNIRLDNDRKAVVIEIPHTKMAPVEIDPEKFEAGETQKGLLAFGELKFTPQEYNNLEREVRSRIEKAVHTDGNFKKADENAVAEMKKIYEPVVKLIDDDYTVEIEFIR